MLNTIDSKNKKRRFKMGTLVESTNENVNHVAHKFIVTVRYHDNEGCVSDYLIGGPRKFLRE